MTRPPLKRRIRVLESVPPPGPIVQYIDQVVRHAPDNIDFTYFSYRSALLGRYDVFHVHWPEWLIRHRSAIATLVRSFLFALLIIRLKAFHIPVVRTVHNIVPHDPGSAPERLLLTRLQKLVHTHVVLTDCNNSTWPGHAVLIPHGHYREAFEAVPSTATIRGRALLFGYIRPYKGVIELIEAAEQMRADVEIRIVGSPTEAMRAQIDAELAKVGRLGAKVTVNLQTVSDDELAKEITQAELVVLPYRDAGNGNSGAALLALSLNRPVLTIRSQIIECLAKEVGEDWVHMADAEVRAADVERSLARARRIPNGAEPQLTGRDWPTIASDYAQVFRHAMENPRLGLSGP